ncbi:hypothetical protein HY483_00415 [Candidatus Woesearchaeota archaeon]|nr:hypothetical protein [Candidatus Woesearchaeota archaeon]
MRSCHKTFWNIIIVFLISLVFFQLVSAQNHDSQKSPEENSRDVFKTGSPTVDDVRTLLATGSPADRSIVGEWLSSNSATAGDVMIKEFVKSSNSIESQFIVVYDKYFSKASNVNDNVALARKYYSINGKLASRENSKGAEAFLQSVSGTSASFVISGVYAKFEDGTPPRLITGSGSDTFLSLDDLRSIPLLSGVEVSSYSIKIKMLEGKSLDFAGVNINDLHHDSSSTFLDFGSGPFEITNIPANGRISIGSREDGTRIDIDRGASVNFRGAQILTSSSESGHFTVKSSGVDFNSLLVSGNGFDLRGSRNGELRGGAALININSAGEITGAELRPITSGQTILTVDDPRASSDDRALENVLVETSGEPLNVHFQKSSFSPSVGNSVFIGSSGLGAKGKGQLSQGTFSYRSNDVFGSVVRDIDGAFSGGGAVTVLDSGVELVTTSGEGVTSENIKFSSKVDTTISDDVNINVARTLSVDSPDDFNANVRRSATLAFDPIGFISEDGVEGLSSSTALRGNFIDVSFGRSAGVLRGPSVETSDLLRSAGGVDHVTLHLGDSLLLQTGAAGVDESSLFIDSYDGMVYSGDSVVPVAGVKVSTQDLGAEHFTIVDNPTDEEISSASSALESLRSLENVENTQTFRLAWEEYQRTGSFDGMSPVLRQYLKDHETGVMSALSSQTEVGIDYSRRLRDSENDVQRKKDFDNDLASREVEKLGLDVRGLMINGDYNGAERVVGNFRTVSTMPSSRHGDYANNALKSKASQTEGDILLARANSIKDTDNGARGYPNDRTSLRTEALRSFEQSVNDLDIGQSDELFEARMRLANMYVQTMGDERLRGFIRHQADINGVVRETFTNVNAEELYNTISSNAEELFNDINSMVSDSPVDMSAFLASKSRYYLATGNAVEALRNSRSAEGVAVSSNDPGSDVAFVNARALRLQQENALLDAVRRGTVAEMAGIQSAANDKSKKGGMFKWAQGLTNQLNPGAYDEAVNIVVETSREQLSDVDKTASILQGAILRGYSSEDVAGMSNIERAQLVREIISPDSGTATSTRDLSPEEFRTLGLLNTMLKTDNNFRLLASGGNPLINDGAVVNDFDVGNTVPQARDILSLDYTDTIAQIWDDTAIAAASTAAGMGVGAVATKGATLAALRIGGVAAVSDLVPAGRMAVAGVGFLAGAGADMAIQMGTANEHTNWWARMGTGFGLSVGPRLLSRIGGSSGGLRVVACAFCAPATINREQAVSAFDDMLRDLNNVPEATKQTLRNSFNEKVGRLGDTFAQTYTHQARVAINDVLPRTGIANEVRQNLVNKLSLAAEERMAAQAARNIAEATRAGGVSTASDFARNSRGRTLSQTANAGRNSVGEGLATEVREGISEIARARGVTPGEVQREIRNSLRLREGQTIDDVLSGNLDQRRALSNAVRTAMPATDGQKIAAIGRLKDMGIDPSESSSELLRAINNPPMVGNRLDWTRLTVGQVEQMTNPVLLFPK